MIKIEKFKEKFKGFENQYVIIGGTACDLIMENEELLFRATKDIDIVLIVEALTSEFGKSFWEYIKEGEYQNKNKSTGEPQFYRFSSPKNSEYPYMIEIFSKKPDSVFLSENATLTPLPIDDEISSLSAIILNESYYNLLRSSQTIINDVAVLDAVSLIPFKAKAWLDLTDKKEKGISVNTKNIKKHKNDVFRLAQLITPSTKQILNREVKEDMKDFLLKMQDEDVDMKSLGIKNIDKTDVIQILSICYGIN